jgi:hypothetical protein
VVQVINEDARYGLLLALGDDDVYRVSIRGEATFDSRVRSAADTLGTFHRASWTSIGVVTQGFRGCRDRRLVADTFRDRAGTLGDSSHA